jgi:hypothetical protein
MSWFSFRTVAVLFFALSHAACAATYCVDLTGSGCDSTSTGAAGLTAALAAAALTAADDTIKIGTGTYLGPFVYAPSMNAGTLTIIGSGTDATTLSVPFPGPTVLAVLKLARDLVGHPANVSQVAIVVPGTANTGIQTDGLIEDARLSSPPGNGGPTGVTLFGSGSGIRRCQIEMNNVMQATGVETDVGTTISPDPSPAFVEDSSVLDGLVTIEAFAPLRITRCRTSGKGNSVIIARGATVTVEDSLVLADSASALRAEPEGGPGSIIVRQVTAVSVGVTPAFAGIDVDADIGNASADVRHSIIRGFANSTFRRAAMNLSATVSISASDYPFGAHLVEGPGTTTLAEPEPNIDADPLFVDALSGNYALRDGSPAIDATYSPPLAPDESPTDLLGAPRIQDGNGDGIAARDMGAFEHAAVPLVTTTTTTLVPTTTTSTTLPCTTPRCLFDAALHGPECAGANVPKGITAKIDGAVGLFDRVGASSGKKQRRLAGRTRRSLNAIAHLATRASKGKKARLSATCASAIGGAAGTVRETLAP